LTSGQAAAELKGTGTHFAIKEENVETVNDLVSSQEDKPQTHRPVQDITEDGYSIHWCTQNAICLHFLPYLLNICRKFEFLIYQGSVATCLKLVGIQVFAPFPNGEHTASTDPPAGSRGGASR